MRRVLGYLTTLLLFWSCGSREPSSAAHPPPSTTTLAGVSPASTPPTDAAPVQIEMKNVRLHLDEGIILDVRRLRGEMVGRPSHAPVFDDPASYRLRVFSGDVGMDATSLTNLMNRHAFGYEGAPLRNISVAIDGERVTQKGELRKAGAWIPFSMKATVSATADGRLKLHAEELRALGIPSTKLLDFLGLTLADLMKVPKERGLAVDDNDVVIAPGHVLPPPQMEGHLSGAVVNGHEVRQTFSPPDGRTLTPLSPPDPLARNYVYMAGSVIQFGKLTMTGADLQLIDLDARDPFDFYPAKYRAQLVAGYSKNTATGGLKTYMPDFADLTPGMDVRPTRQ